MYDYHVLDMIELGVDKVKFMSDFKVGESIIQNGTRSVHKLHATLL